FIEKHFNFFVSEVGEPSVGTPFDAWQALPSNSICNDRRGAVETHWNAGKSELHLVKIVSIDPIDEPSERCKFFIHRFKRDQLFGSHIRLKLIPVHNRNKVVEFICSSYETTFPNRTFIEFPVAKNHKDAIGPSSNFYVKCDAYRDRKQVAERPGMEFNSRDRTVRMPVHRIVRAEMIFKPALFDISEFCKGTVQCRNVMSLGKEKVITVLILQGLMGDAENFRIEIDDQVCA